MSGDYRDMVDIQTDAGPDDNPQPSFTTVLHKDVPCEIKAVGGGERYRGRQIEAGVDYVVRMHYLEDFTSPTARLYVRGGLHAGKVLNITRMLPSTFRGMPIELQIDCKELVT